MPHLVDEYGRPVSARKLEGEQATVSVTGLRPPSFTEPKGALTPDRLATIFRDAEDGDHWAQVELTKEMEDRYPHFFAVLQTRKLGVHGNGFRVDAASDEDRDKEAAEIVRKELVESEGFEPMVMDLLDGIAQPFSVVEIFWRQGTKYLSPRAFEYRDQRHFIYDRERLHTLRLYDASGEGEELWPFKYLIHHHKIRSGLRARGGIARLAAIAHMAHSFSLKAWLGFLEIYGIPVRVGKYEGTLSDEERKKFVNAISNLATDAGAIIPSSMEIEMHGNAGGQGALPFEPMAEYLDKQISKMTLGQTMTTDNGSSLAQAKVHEGVRQDWKESDARQIQATIHRDLTVPWCRFNLGELESYPKIRANVEPPEDVEQLAKVIPAFVNLGLKVEQRTIYDKLGIDPPDENADDDALLKPPAPPPSSSNDGPPPRDEARERAAVKPDEVQPLDETTVDDWEPIMEGLIDPIVQAAEEATDYADFQKRLKDVAGKLDSNEFVQRLAVATFKARGSGDARG